MPSNKNQNPKFNESFVPAFQEGLRRLTQEELEYLEQAITPEISFLLTKAFGPDMGVMLWPFIVDDEMKAFDF